MFSNIPIVVHMISLSSHRIHVQIQTAMILVSYEDDCTRRHGIGARLSHVDARSNN
jgi:hypothetical protein